MVIVLVAVVVAQMYRAEGRSYRNILAVIRVGEDCDTVSVLNAMVCVAKIYGNVRRRLYMLNYTRRVNQFTLSVLQFEKLHYRVCGKALCTCRKYDMG